MLRTGNPMLLSVLGWNSFDLFQLPQRPCPGPQFQDNSEPSLPKPGGGVADAQAKSGRTGGTRQYSSESPLIRRLRQYREDESRDAARCVVYGPITPIPDPILVQVGRPTLCVLPK